jgi:hypothetical protein
LPIMSLIIYYSSNRIYLQLYFSIKNFTRHLIKEWMLIKEWTAWYM